MAIAADYELDYLAPVQRHEATEGTFDEIGSTQKSYNNVSAGRRVRGYQKQLAKACRGIATGLIKPNNRAVCEFCECGSKVGARILTDLVKRYPDSFERSQSGRVRFASAA